MHVQRTSPHDLTTSSRCPLRPRRTILRRALHATVLIGNWLKKSSFETIAPNLRKSDLVVPPRKWVFSCWGLTPAVRRLQRSKVDFPRLSTATTKKKFRGFKDTLITEFCDVLDEIKLLEKKNSQLSLALEAMDKKLEI